MRLAVAPLLVLAACGDPAGDGDAGADAAIHDGAGSDAAALLWYAGTLRALPSVEADLITFVDGLEHPEAGGYLTLDGDRAGRFDAFVDAMLAAVDASLADGRTGDWCAVQALAADAGYGLQRFHDEATGRWLLHGRDLTAAGQAYFFVNPEARRDLVVEAPHEPHDLDTSVEGARIFLALAARALIINKEHRCSDPDPTACDGTTTACAGYYRESDVAHDLASTFHRLHVRFSDGGAGTRFAQLHGFGGGAGDRAEIGDGTYNDVDPDAVSTRFAASLAARVPDPDAVHSCQGATGEPPTGLCGSTNVQGRHTNAPAGDACVDGTPVSGGRFLHIEQDLTLRDDDAADGWSWQQVSDALHDTWPECPLNGAGCALGPPQPAQPDCPCGQVCW